jgi:hypothetical protein
MPRSGEFGGPVGVATVAFDIRLRLVVTTHRGSPQLVDLLSILQTNRVDDNAVAPEPADSDSQHARSTASNDHVEDAK